MVKMVYSQELVHVDSGDVVCMVSTSKGQRMWKSLSHQRDLISQRNQRTVKRLNQFDMSGVYYYWCTPHKGMGMIGLVVVDGDTSNIDAIAKAKAMGKSKKKLKALLENCNDKDSKMVEHQTNSCS